jgi:Domain of unknown function (DUF1844)
MADKQKSEFTVSDRRIFTPEGDLRPEAPVEEAARAKDRSEPRIVIPGAEDTGAPAQCEAQPDYAPPPTEAEQRESRDAFKQSSAAVDKALDEALGPQGKGEPLEATFESFVASLYMSAMLQLGLLHERGEQPQIDIVGARHTINTLAMIEEKTRGNLSESEKSMLQDTLFRLRMAFVEMTNALTRPPDTAAPGAPGRK